MNLPLWDISAFLAATNGRPVGTMPEEVTGVSIDTRTLEAGNAFFAIKGDRFDGHDFLTAAMKAGAGLAVVTEEKLVALGRINLPLVVVRDVLATMEQLGMAARARTKARIVAVTGSVGKTTTKEMVRTVLAPSGKVHAAEKSYNNHWGVPLTLANMPSDTRFGIFEIGMNHPGEIRPLVKMVRPHLAMITNVAAVHLGAFDDVDGIARAKAEIFEGIVEGGYALVNHDDERFEMLCQMAREAGVKQIADFGLKQGSQYRLISSKKPAGEEKTSTLRRLSFDLDGTKYSGSFSVPGKHMLANAVAAMAVCHLAGADLEKSLEALAAVKAVRGRGERHRLKLDGGEALLIDESYNANPTSMAAAIAALGEARDGEGRLIAILGDMLELGASSPELHAGLATAIKRAKIDETVLVGPDMAGLYETLVSSKSSKITLHHFDDWKAALEYVLKILQPGDAVMAKASLGLRFANIVDGLLDRFSVDSHA